MVDTYKNVKINKDKKKGEMEITGDIPYETVAEYRKDVVEDIRKDLEAPGFRKGNAPDDVVVKKVGEPKILQQAAEAALQDVVPQILKDEAMRVLGSPQVAITKIASGNDVGFKVKAAMVPNAKLPKYKKIAKQVISETDVSEDVEVTDDDVEAVLTQLRMMRAGKDEDPAELNDAFASEVGFDDVDTLRAQVRKNLEAEKKMDNKKGLREKIVEALVDAAEVKIPEMVVNQEVGLIRGRFYQELSQAGMTMEDYLEKAGTTEDELNEQHRDHVIKQLKAKFVIEQIAEEEDLKPDEKELKQQKQVLQSRHPDATDEQIENHLQSALTHEKVFKFLENQLIEA